MTGYRHEPWPASRSPPWVPTDCTAGHVVGGLTSARPTGPLRCRTNRGAHTPAGIGRADVPAPGRVVDGGPTPCTSPAPGQVGRPIGPPVSKRDQLTDVNRAVVTLRVVSLATSCGGMGNTAAGDTPAGWATRQATKPGGRPERRTSRNRCRGSGGSIDALTPHGNHRENPMMNATATGLSLYEQRVVVVQNVVRHNTRLGKKTSADLAVLVLHALDHIPEKVRWGVRRPGRRRGRRGRAWPE